MTHLKDHIFQQSSFLEMFLWSAGYFLLMYFFLALLFIGLSQILAKAGYAERIVPEKASSPQIRFEIKHSLLSIAVFGFSLAPIVYGVRGNWIQLLPDTLPYFILSMLGLFLWNELHFYLVHRLMHIPFFMRRVHRIHHRSFIPTVWSIYSFHPLESFLLSTVLFLYALVVPTSPMAVFAFPMLSILLNLSGHANYRIRATKKYSGFATKHNRHHSRYEPSYGFALNIFDRLFKTSKH